MVFEPADTWPSFEGQSAGAAAAVVLRLPEAGGRVLATAAWDQYQLPYTILRPFNCVGIGEERASATSRCSAAT
jgi:hypothetical protein